MTMTQTRRQFLSALSLAGAAGLVRAPPVLAAEAPPEITSVRLPKGPNACIAPSDLAEELLRAEGFSDIRYVDAPFDIYQNRIERGEVDFGLNFALDHIISVDRGAPIVVLTGVHVGCIEVLSKKGVGGMTDLKGKSVGVPSLGSPPHMFIALMAAQIGLEPSKDINWVVSGSVDPMQLFVDGKIDAFMSYPPQAQELHARHVGHVLLKTAVDHPWSQYFCCMLAGNRKFVRNYPAATKRVTRAILKAADLCATDPVRAARRMVDFDSHPRYDDALQILSELQYDKWREYDPEDTIRFYALRLRDSGFIKSSPQKIIAEGTDWRFLDEVKRELKV
jgi:NitT/TauT family transport system substrate-binding protein